MGPLLLLAAAALAAPVPNHVAASFDWDRSAPLEARAVPIPAWLLDAWRKADGHPEYADHALTPGERRAVKAALDGLPPEMRRVLAERQMALYFVDHLQGNGITDWALDASSRTFVYTIVNAASLRKTVSSALTERERSAFRGLPDLSVDAGEGPGVEYALFHELAHSFDYVRGLTPLVEPGHGRATGRRVPKKGWDAWAEYGRPRPEADYPGREKLAFYGFGGPKLDAADAPKLCAGLASSPFVSLYGSRSWAEDAADLFVAWHLTRDLGRPYRYACGGKVFEPMKDPRVAARAARVLAPLYGTQAR